MTDDKKPSEAPSDDQVPAEPPPPYEPDPDLIAYAERGAEPGDTKVRIPAGKPENRR
jgi:hypothetical protein